MRNHADHQINLTPEMLEILDQARVFTLQPWEPRVVLKPVVPMAAEQSK